jgi:hypothetical protein
MMWDWLRVVCCRPSRFSCVLARYIRSYERRACKPGRAQFQLTEHPSDCSSRARVSFKLKSEVKRSMMGDLRSFKSIPRTAHGKVRELDLSEAQYRIDPRSTICLFCRVTSNFTSFVDHITAMTMYCNLIATAST